MMRLAENLVPLYNLEAEMSVLGSILLKGEVAADVLEIITEDDLYSPSHKEILRAVRQLVASSKAVDLITVKAELLERGALADVGGTEYLIQIAEFVPTPANAAHYARIVQEMATLRRLEDAGHKIAKIVHDPDEGDANEKIDRAEQLVFDVGSKRLGKDFIPVRSLATEFFRDVDHIIESGEPTLGLPSGFYDLDHMTTGFNPGDFSIVAARPSMGKTSFVLNIAINVAQKDPGNVAIFSLEMSGKQLVRRMASMISGVSSHALKRPNLPSSDYQALADACETLYGLPIFIDESSDISGLEMRGKCRRLKREGGLSMVIVDYLQLMRGNRKTENRVQEISDIARSLKALAKELEVPVIALSQLNRGVENRENKRPQLSDIRESGSIEAEADLVMFIFREQYYKDRESPAEANHDPERVEEAEIIIAKHRNGPTGHVTLGFQPSYARFRNLQR
jgi:replicative DNA helicase